MKKKFASLIVGALLALAVPASAMGSGVYPTGAVFEIAPTSTESKPTVGTSLGSCALTKIWGQIPAAPANETQFEILKPTVGECTSGTTLTLEGKWLAQGSGYNFNITGGGPFGSGIVGATLRYSSLPGCKLKSVGPTFFGVWSNGVSSPTMLKSGYHAHGTTTWVWDNDGGTCALAGKTELVRYSQETGVASSMRGTSSVVNVIGNPTGPIIVR
jgi:hypothetical protein